MDPHKHTHKCVHICRQIKIGNKNYRSQKMYPVNVLGWHSEFKMEKKSWMWRLEPDSISKKEKSEEEEKNNLRMAQGLHSVPIYKSIHKVFVSLGI